jgi:predicted Zn finger-like uncharacterized protein
MNVQCTHCSTVFRVDPRKVPAAGVRVRCSICRGVFEVAGTAAAPAPAAAPAEPAAPAVPQPTPQPERAADPAPQPASAAAPPAGPAFQPSASAPAAPPPAGVPAPASTPAPAAVPAAPVPTPVATPAPAASAAAPRPAAPPAATPSRSPFGAADPDAKARRLARALVSDIVTYHPERRDKALAAGTLRTEFREEITKSWQEYVGQVGEAAAKSSPHFRTALNDILAKGQQVF